jgi:1-aminocyclopropane-1-carboxylate deaminase/D-cysteine desulfhydrase-like pyridoxal-dependent ACC family enzyme
LALGGNKTRKLEFLLAEARANGAKTLITTGAVQSNHCRQTAAAARRFGFDCILVLVVPIGEDIPSNQNQQPSGNLLLDRLLGAEIIWSEWEARETNLQKAFQSAWDTGRRPYLIPYGGSSPAGASAYAFAVQELLGQEIHPDWIIFPSSSGGTHAGLEAGARLFGYKGRILGISVDETATILAQRVAKLAVETADFLSEKLEISPTEIGVNEDYQWPGYGVLVQSEVDVIRTFARSEGLLLDPVYTARAAAGMLDMISKGSITMGSTVLFWHTGGTPALFADRYRQFQ